MAETTFDVVVVGGGPGGYVAAIRAAQLGLQAAVVEREHLGGICLNWGCIPTKTLLHTADLYREMQDAERYGLTVEASFDIEKVVSRSRSVARQLTSGVKFLLRKNKVQVFDGSARLTGGGGVVVENDGVVVAELGADSIILATGARARSLPGLEPDGELVWTYKEAMVPTAMPDSLLVIGSGGDRRGVRELLPGAGGGGDGGGGAAAHPARRGRGDLGLRAGGVREAGHHDSHQRHRPVPREGR